MIEISRSCCPSRTGRAVISSPSTAHSARAASTTLTSVARATGRSLTGVTVSVTDAAGQVTAYDWDAQGNLVCYNEVTTVVRGAGGFGGDRGPAGESNAAPERAPDAVISEKTHENQALLYRLSGDWNPLHADPGFAQAVGYPRPILHGLCSFGFAVRHVIKGALDNDARRFKSVKAR